MTHPNLLRLGRSCAKWRGGTLLVATLSLLVGGVGCHKQPPPTDAEVKFWTVVAHYYPQPQPMQVILVGGERLIAGLTPGNEAWSRRTLNLPTIPIAPTGITVAQLPRTDSASYRVTWTAVTGAISYHTRLVGGNAAMPALGADYPAGMVYHQLGARVVDTITVANPVDSTYAKIAVRAFDATGLGPFATSKTFYVKRYAVGIPTTITMVVVPSALSPLAGYGHQFYAMRDSAGVILVQQSATWTSSDTTVVAVNTMGYGLFLKAGTATVRAQLGTLSATSAITVNPSQPRVIGITAKFLTSLGVTPIPGTYGPWPIVDDAGVPTAYLTVTVAAP